MAAIYYDTLYSCVFTLNKSETGSSNIWTIYRKIGVSDTLFLKRNCLIIVELVELQTYNNLYYSKANLFISE